MYLFALFSSLVCIQLISTIASEPSDAGQSSLIQPATLLTADSDEEYAYVPRSTSFLRFGRQLPSSSGAFLRFGRSQPTFLRFGRSNANAANFLRFGRQTSQENSNPFLRFGRKGEFLRFG